MAIYLSAIPFTRYAPTTILGLLGVVCAYLYYYFSNRDNNRLKTIRSVPAKDRLSALEAMLSETGVHLPTDGLSPEIIYDLLVRSLRTKHRKWLTVAVVSVILGILTTFLVYHYQSVSAQTTPENPPIVFKQENNGSGDQVGLEVNSPAAADSMRKFRDSLNKAMSVLMTQDRAAKAADSLARMKFRSFVRKDSANTPSKKK